MGAILSQNGSRATTSKVHEVSQRETCRSERMSLSNCEGNQRLIPSLPDELSIQILARLPRIFYLDAKLVSQSWKAAILNHELYMIRKELGRTEEWLYILTKVDDGKLMWYALDPLSRKWQRLPPMPYITAEDEDGSKRGFAGIWMSNIVGSSIKIADAVRGWLGWKDTLDRLPFCGCGIGALDGCLYVPGGFSRTSAMSCVRRYDPILNAWSEVSPMTIGRACCKTGVLNNKLYVVGGVSMDHGGLTSLQSAEVYDPRTGLWSQIPSMPFLKVQALPTALLRDLLKPIATGMMSYRGKLYVAQSLYYWQFFVDVGGEMYDPETNSWVEMPVGMGEGWPARKGGSKLSVIVNGNMYALDPSSSLDCAKIKVYDYEDDAWKVVGGHVPICDFTNSESPYLLAGFLGKFHVIAKDANNNIAVIQADTQNHLGSVSSTLTPLDGSSHELSESVAGSETYVWKVIATRSGGSAELISCQVLDI